MKHYHRCPWCGVLVECNDVCTQGGPYDSHDKSEWEPNGLVLPGVECDSDCYDRKRPRGCQYDMTEDGRHITFSEKPF